MLFSEFYHKIPRRVKIFCVFILIVLAVYLLVYFLTPVAQNVPEEFLRARQEASLIAKDIIFISSQTADNINKISDLDRDKNYTEALNLISAELNNNREARNKAVNLSAQLEIMTKNISQISPPVVSQIALEAVGSETTLISRLITYNDYLVQLLGILQKKFLGQEKNSNEKITELISKINEEAKAINNLDKNFNDLMKQFDGQ
ncbi:MAG: hypothetical protein UU85_C0007G0025 [Candidatus Wolfebacteria bacterium GW2011_GWA2_42_10]|uniref:DUF5667 domain-containing protein n=2 Tax=Candidatus Wolfeibacteriota TaxID=1752735 RepID=A0A0G0XJM4_9BACT|nr:MAG: hypothetical protein UU38_C0003G0233 [Candidatus Wolfebacteria bacterium GW2011_GWB1_41_12]KKS25110.1 MAG: hypothetical protein UU85_C0007G0025 [Candidatus Wolfebacteria bacterium GW2011_GWA2_42_10]KKT56325.1 MAG: hypothetical protein UW50_C0002G0002 [Candidatus Wolfebacteria bacterium GW2011_GWA1_44_24]